MSYPGPADGSGRPRTAPSRGRAADPGRSGASAAGRGPQLPGTGPGRPLAQGPGRPPGQGPSRPLDPEQDLDRREVEATLAAQRELGPDMQDALVDSFTDKVERAIELRVAGEVAARGPASRPENGSRLALAIVSAAVGVPLTGICAGTGLGLSGLLIVWIGLVLINLAFSRRR